MESQAISNILHISVGKNWGSRERLILRDSEAVKEGGRTVYLYCHEESTVKAQAHKRGMQVIVHRTNISSKLSIWKNLASLSRLIRKFNIQLIHFYEVELIWPLACFLYRFVAIPLVFTQCDEVKKFYTGILHRSLSRRVDLVLFSLPGIKENVVTHLHIHPRKIHFCGMAPPCVAAEQGPDQRRSAQADKDFLLLGVHLSGKEREIAPIKRLFQGLAVFNQRIDRPVHLKLVSENAWERNPLYQQYRELSWEFQVGSWITFERIDSFADFWPQIDLWVGLETQEDFEDYSLQASLQGIPFLAPRSTPSMELIQSYGKMGECYKRGDGREFWQKGLKILHNLDHYRENLERAGVGLRTLYDMSHYKRQLLELYDGVGTRRLAYVKRMARI